jgi:hypothetical protein
LIAVILAGLIGLIFGILAKSQPVISGIAMIIAAVIALVAIFLCPAAWFWNLAMLILFLIGGIMAITKKEEVDVP